MKIKNILFLLLLIQPIISISQVDTTKVYDVVDVAPEYPGGAVEMVKFIQENFKYPEVAKMNGEQGTVWVEFVIYNDGTLRDINVVKGVSESLDNECIRVVSVMPDWTPGEQDGGKVHVRYTIPIKITLDTGKKKKKRLFKRN